jgi:hypothetical protein
VIRPTGRYNDQTLFSTQWKQISCPPLDRQTKVEEKPSGVWSERIYQCPQRPTSPATLLVKQISPNPENPSMELAYQKQNQLMPHFVPVRPQSRYPRAPRDTGSTLSQPQLHPPTSRYTSAYIRKPADEFDAIAKKYNLGHIAWFFQMFFFIKRMGFSRVFEN